MSNKQGSTNDVLLPTTSPDLLVSNETKAGKVGKGK